MSNRFPRVLTMMFGLLTLPAPVAAGPEYDTGTGGVFRYYGHLNPAFLSFDDGVSTTEELADNEASSSRVGFTVTQPFGENELLFRFETSLGFRATAEFSQTSKPQWHRWERNRLRHLDIRYKTTYGSIYIGQGSMASDGIGDRTFSGTGLATPLSIGDTAGSFRFRTSGGTLSGVRIAGAFRTFDGSRKGRIRYDTPSVAGVNLRIAYGQDILTDGNDDEFYDIALAYADQLDNGVSVVAGLGYQVSQRAVLPDLEDVFASFAFELPSGVNGTFAVGERDQGGRYVYLQAGYNVDIWAFGKTSVSVDLYRGSDHVTAGDRSHAYGVGIVQNIDAANLEVYLGYRRYSYEDSLPVTYQDAQSYILGARWSF